VNALAGDDHGVAAGSALSRSRSLKAPVALITTLAAARNALPVSASRHDSIHKTLGVFRQS